MADPDTEEFAQAVAAASAADEELHRLRAAVARVRGLHEPYRTAWTDAFDVCTGCTRGMDLEPYPCPTIKALEGTDG